MVAALALGLTVIGPTTTARADDPPAPPAPRHFTMAVSGDVIPLPSVINRAMRNAGGQGYDFRPMFADLKPLISSVDLAICHLEIPVAPPGTKPTGYPRWSTPPSIADALVDAGYDRCSTASNHTLDKGVAGIDATLNAFDAAGLAHSGSARTPEEAVATVFEVNGIRVVHLSYTFGFNGFRLPAAQPWRANLIDQARILADAGDARARGAEFVVVSLHWGVEGAFRPMASQRTLANALTSSGLVDVIVGHHPHRLQSIEQVNGRWVMYSLGNSVSNHRLETKWPAASEDGVVVTLEITEQPGGGFGVTSPVVHPTWSEPVTFAAYDALAHASDPGFARPTLRRMARSLARTRRLLGAYFPVAASDFLKQVLEDDPPYGAHIEYRADKKSTGWDAPATAPWLEASLRAASTDAFGHPARAMGEGGSISFMGMLGLRFPEAQFVVTGVLGPGSNAHGPNEFLHIPTAKKITAVIANVLRDHAAAHSS